MGALLEGCAFGEMAVLGLTTGQSVTIKVGWNDETDFGNQIFKSTLFSPDLRGWTDVWPAVPQLLWDLAKCLKGIDPGYPPFPNGLLGLTGLKNRFFLLTARNIRSSFRNSCSSRLHAWVFFQFSGFRDHTGGLPTGEGVRTSAFSQNNPTPTVGDFCVLYDLKSFRNEWNNIRVESCWCS